MARNMLRMLVCLFFMGALAGPALAFGVKSYSADVETTTSMGTHLSRIYAKDGKQRMEGGSKGKESITIIRPDKKVMWVLMPDKKMYMEMSTDQQKQDIQSQLHSPDVKAEKELIGNEHVDGRSTKKYHLVIVREGKKEKGGFIWEAPDLNNFPVKYQSEDKSVTSLWKNIKMGDVPDSLFEVPAGYKKMEMPGMGGPKGKRN